MKNRYTIQIIQLWEKYAYMNNITDCIINDAMEKSFKCMRPDIYKLYDTDISIDQMVSLLTNAEKRVMLEVLQEAEKNMKKDGIVK